MPGSQTAEDVSASVCTIFKQQKPLQVHSPRSLHMAYCPAGKKCEECFWEEQSTCQVSQSREGGIWVWRDNVLLLCLPCDTETNQAGRELSSQPSRNPAWQPSLPLLYSRIHLMHGLNNQVQIMKVRDALSVWHLMRNERWWEGVNGSVFHSLLHFSFGWHSC